MKNCVKSFVSLPVVVRRPMESPVVYWFHLTTLLTSMLNHLYLTATKPLCLKERMLLVVDINLLTKNSHATCTTDTRCARKPLNFWFGVGVNSRLQSINNHHLEEGLVETVHKNTEHLPHHAIACSLMMPHILWGIFRIMRSKLLYCSQAAFRVTSVITWNCCPVVKANG